MRWVDGIVVLGWEGNRAVGRDLAKQPLKGCPDNAARCAGSLASGSW